MKSKHPSIPFLFLVVDADSGMRSTAYNQLKAHQFWVDRPWYKFEFMEAASIVEAREIIEIHLPDAVLCTIRVPHLQQLQPLPSIPAYLEKNSLDYVKMTLAGKHSSDWSISDYEKIAEESQKRSSWNGPCLFPTCIRQKIPLISFFYHKWPDDPISKGIFDSFESDQVSSHLVFTYTETETKPSTQYVKGGERGEYSPFLDRLIIDGVPDLMHNYNNRLLRTEHYRDRLVAPPTS